MEHDFILTKDLGTICEICKPLNYIRAVGKPVLFCDLSGQNSASNRRHVLTALSASVLRECLKN